MKAIIIPIAALGLALASCSDDKATQPTAAFTVDANRVEVNQSVTVRFTGNADNVVVFPGDQGQDYDLIKENNTGLVVNKGLFTYAYSTPGTYKMVAWQRTMPTKACRCCPTPARRGSESSTMPPK